MTYLQKRLEALDREVFLVERVVVDNLLLGFAHAPEEEDACHMYPHTHNSVERVVVDNLLLGFARAPEEVG